MTTYNLNYDKTGTINPDFLDALSEEIKSVSYLISAIGDSVFNTGVPSDPAVFNITMSKLAERLDEVAETMDIVKAEIMDEDPGESE